MTRLDTVFSPYSPIRQELVPPVRHDCSYLCRQREEAHMFEGRPALARLWRVWHEHGGGDGQYHLVSDVLPTTELRSGSTWFALRTLVEEGYLMGEAPPEPSGISPFYLKSTRFRKIR